VPNCYHVTTSTPEKAGKSIKECVRDVGGPGKLVKLQTDGRKTYSEVEYETLELAYQYLGPLTDCMRSKGHEVHDARVLANFEEIGLAGPDQSAD
jgi:hypothetical protein